MKINVNPKNGETIKSMVNRHHLCTALLNANKRSLSPERLKVEQIRLDLLEAYINQQGGSC